MSQQNNSILEKLKEKIKKLSEQRQEAKHIFALPDLPTGSSYNLYNLDL